jgi:hypothetical protein
MAGNNTVKNRRFGIAGDISPNAFADGEIRFRDQERIIPGRISLRERDDRIWMDRCHESGSRELPAATYLTVRHLI